MKNWNAVGKRIEALGNLVAGHTSARHEIKPYDSRGNYTSQQLFEYCNALLDKVDQLHADNQEGTKWINKADEINWEIDKISRIYEKAVLIKEAGQDQNFKAAS